VDENRKLMINHRRGEKKKLDDVKSLIVRSDIRHSGERDVNGAGKKRKRLRKRDFRRKGRRPIMNVEERGKLSYLALKKGRQMFNQSAEKGRHKKKEKSGPDERIGGGR